MSALARWSSRFRLLILAVGAGIIATGVALLPGLTVEAVPEFDPPHLQVQTEALGLSAEEVEQLITAPMEADILNGVAFLDEMRSESVPGLSSIDLLFKPGTNLRDARQLVGERLTRTRALPHVSQPPVLMQPLSSTSRVMMIRLSSPDVPIIDLSVLARWNIKPRLMGVPGVANVAIWGQREQQMQVQVDPARLAASGVTLNQIIETTGNAVWVSPLSFLRASAPGSGGFIETGNQRLGIQHVLPITTPADLSRVSIEHVAGPSRTLGDVATVVENHQPLIGDAATGGDPGLVLVIEKFPGMSTVAVTAAIDQALDDLRPGLRGVKVDASIYRPATSIESTARSLGLGSLLSVLVVAGLLALVFRSWRLGLLVLVVLVVTVGGTLGALSLLGTGMNTMIFAGLVLAMTVVVGDAVADMHSLRRLRPDGAARPGGEGLDVTREQRSGLLAHALRASRTAAGFGSLVAVISLLPAVFLGGIEAAFFRPLVLAVALALAIALILGWTLTIGLVVILLRSGPSRRPSRVVLRSRDAYGSLLSRWVRRAPALLAGAAVLALAGAVLLPVLATTARSVPVLTDSNLVVRLDAKAGTSIDEMGRITERARAAVAELPGVTGVAGHVGRAIASDQVVGVSSGELWVRLDGAHDRSTVKGLVQGAVRAIPGLRADVVGYAEGKVGDSLRARRTQFAVRIFGVHMDALRQQADLVSNRLRQVPGVSGIALDLPPTEPVAEIEVSLAAAEKAGIKPGEVRRAAAALVQGIDVGFLFERQKVFQVVVTGVPTLRHSLTSVGELLIDTPAGGRVRLRDVATIRVVPRDTTIRHVDTQRYIDVVASVDGRPVYDVATEVQRAVRQMTFPREYHAEVPAQYAAEWGTGPMTAGILLAVVLGVLVLLATAVRSWRLAFAILLLLPLALSGGAAVALLSGGATFVTLAALAVVLGATVRDAILLVLTARRRQAEVPSHSRPQVVVEASRERLLPTALSGLLAGLALVPLVVLGGAVGHDVLLPLAAVVWGGLLTSWLVTLVVLPLLLCRISVPAGDEAFEGDHLPAIREGML